MEQPVKTSKAGEDTQDGALARGLAQVRTMRPGLVQQLRLPLGSPFQLVLFIVSFVLAGYAGVRLLAGDWFAVALWFIGSAVLHDLVLVPLYSAVDRAALRLAGAVGRRQWVPYVRTPALLSALLLLVWFPLISGRMADHYRDAVGLPGDVFLGRWLLVTAALFAVSALVFVVRLRRATKERPPTAH